VIQPGAGGIDFEIPFTTWGNVYVNGEVAAFNGGVTQNGGSVVLGDGLLNTNSYSLAGGSLDLGGAGRARLTVTGGLTISQGASFGGLGEVVGDVTNGGTVTPGLSGAPLGVLLISGNYTQNATGVLILRIEGVQNQHDTLSVARTATLDGFLQVLAPTGFNPVVGASFRILECGHTVGNFVTPYRLPPLGGQLSWSISFVDSGLTLTVKQ
jgi:hypothetical protein